MKYSFWPNISYKRRYHLVLFHKEYCQTKNSDWIFKIKEEGITCLLGLFRLINNWYYLKWSGKVYKQSGNKEKDIFKRARKKYRFKIIFNKYT